MYFFVFIAALGALIFAVAAVRQPRLGLFAAAVVWALYTVYEYYIATGVLCDANCNIRVDLLLIWPLVLCASLVGIYPPSRWTRTGKVIGGLGLFLFLSMAAGLVYMMFAEAPTAPVADNIQKEP